MALGTLAAKPKNAQNSKSKAMSGVTGLVFLRYKASLAVRGLRLRWWIADDLGFGL